MGEIEIQSAPPPLQKFNIGNTRRQLHNLESPRDIVKRRDYRRLEEAGAVMAQPLAIAQKSLLVFFRCCSRLSQCTLALFMGVLLLSESVSATPGQMAVRTAQQLNATAQDD